VHVCVEGELAIYGGEARVASLSSKCLKELEVDFFVVDK
jgi:hypothetical protein